MRSGTCPKCRATEIIELDEVTDQIGSEGEGLVQQVFVCVGCRFIEFYAKDVEKLRALAARVQKRRRSAYR